MYTTFERIGIMNGLNKLVCPFIRPMEHNLVESRLCLEDREEPNIEMCLRRIKEMETLVRKLDEERKKWEMSLKDE
jgi:hypothetical protein